MEYLMDVQWAELCLDLRVYLFRVVRNSYVEYGMGISVSSIIMNDDDDNGEDNLTFWSGAWFFPGNQEDTLYVR